MTRVLVLIGSPRGKKSNSSSVGEHLQGILKERDFETDLILIRPQLTSEERIKEMINAIIKADIIVLTAPLYDDCQPYIVTKTMEILRDRKVDLTNKEFLPIIGCGFPEPEQISAVSIPIYKKFASAEGLQWAGSLAIGGGEMLGGREGKKLEDVPTFARNVVAELEKIVDSFETG